MQLAVPLKIRSTYIFLSIKSHISLFAVDNNGLFPDVHLPQPFHLLPDFLRDSNHLIYTLLTGHTGTICPMGQLVGVVAESGHFSQQVRVMGTGARANGFTHNQRPQKPFTGQPALRCQLVQMLQFLLGKPQRNDLAALPSGHRTASGCPMRICGLWHDSRVNCFFGTPVRFRSVLSGR